MARYSNPKVPQRTFKQSTQGEHRDTLKLVLGIAALIGVLLIAADRTCYYLAPHIPFAWERQMAQQLGLEQAAFAAFGGTGSKTETEKNRAAEQALQARVEVLRQQLKFPADMPITVHFIDNDTVNAAATLGGHVAVFRGLLDQAQSQEELDAVLAHELGHVRHRHMARQVSRGLVIATGLSLIGIRSNGIFQWLLGDLQQLEQLASTRDAERESDEDAIQASLALYGHTQGMVALFNHFQALEAKHGHATDHLGWLRSHPLSAERAQTAQSANTRYSGGELTPLPAALLAVKK